MTSFIVTVIATVIGVIIAEMIVSVYYESEHSEYEVYRVDHQDGE